MSPVISLITIALVSISVSTVKAQLQTTSAGFPIADCGTRQGCVGFPDSSCLMTGKCSILLKFAYDPAVPDKVPVEIYGIPPPFRPQNFWIAVGFNNEPHRMGGAVVTECVYNNGAAGVFSSRNVPNAYINQRTLLTGVLPGNGTLFNGILGCSFVLDRVRTVSGVTFDLAQPFFVIAGNGPAMGSGIRQHFQTPSMSADAIVFAPQVEMSAATVVPLSSTTLRAVLFEKFVESSFEAPSTTQRSVNKEPLLPADQVPNLQPQNVNHLNNAPPEDVKMLSHVTVANMLMKYIEPPLKMIIDLLNRGNFVRFGGNR